MLSEENWTYNEETGVIDVNVENQKENNNIYNRLHLFINLL